MFRQQVFVKQFVLARSLEPQGWKRGRAFIVLIPTHQFCNFIDINNSKYKAVFIYFWDKDGLFLWQQNKNRSRPDTRSENDFLLTGETRRIPLQ